MGILVVRFGVPRTLASEHQCLHDHTHSLVVNGYNLFCGYGIMDSYDIMQVGNLDHIKLEGGMSVQTLYDAFKFWKIEIWFYKKDLGKPIELPRGWLSVFQATELKYPELVSFHTISTKGKQQVRMNKPA